MSAPPLKVVVDKSKYVSPAVKALQASDGLPEYSIDNFLDLILPDESTIFKVPPSPYEDRMNHIKWVKTIILGDSGEGKTETARLLVEKIVQRYSEAKLEAIIVPRPLFQDFLTMPYMLPGKPIKAIFMDDAADIRLNERQKDTWHRMRHVVKDRAKTNVGLILSFCGTQEYYALPKTLRVSWHCFIAKSAPTNEKDERDVKRIFGTEALAKLQRYTREKIHNRQEYDFAVFKTLGVTGWFKTPLAKTDYFSEFRYLG